MREKASTQVLEHCYEITRETKNELERYSRLLLVTQPLQFWAAVAMWSWAGRYHRRRLNHKRVVHKKRNIWPFTHPNVIPNPVKHT